MGYVNLYFSGQECNYNNTLILPPPPPTPVPYHHHCRATDCKSICLQKNVLNTDIHVKSCTLSDICSLVKTNFTSFIKTNFEKSICQMSGKDVLKGTNRFVSFSAPMASDFTPINHYFITSV